MSLVKRITIDGTSYDIAPANMDSVPTADSENPISSGGIKSYLESSYVPLSATQAPVTGLTDILTPVNLLPNSDFSRDGGYAATQTWETLTGGTNYFSYNWYVAPNLSTFNNVSLTINNDKSITITGTAISTTRSDGKFALILHSIFINHYDFFTLACDKSNVSNCDVFPQTNGTFEEVYSNQENGRSVMILKDTSTNTSMHAVFSILVPGDKINQQFSITLKNLVAYEGEFKNPPATTSLDVKPNSQFLLRDRDIREVRSLAGASINGVLEKYYSGQNTEMPTAFVKLYYSIPPGVKRKYHILQILGSNGNPNIIWGSVRSCGQSSYADMYNCFDFTYSSLFNNSNPTINREHSKYDINLFRSTSYIPITFSLVTAGGGWLFYDMTVDTTAISNYNYIILLSLNVICGINSFQYTHIVRGYEDIS